MRDIQLNDGTVATCGDMNYITSGSLHRYYWYDTYSTPINLNSIYSAISDMGVGDLSALGHFVAGDTISDSDWENIKNNFYYVAGGVSREEDVPSSGVAVTKDATPGYINVIVFTDTVSSPYSSKLSYVRTTPEVGVGSGSNADNILYLVDQTHYNGGVWTGSNGKGVNFIVGAYNVEYFQLAPDDTPLYDVVAEQYTNMVAINDTAEMYNLGIRKCPNITDLNYWSYTANKTPFWYNIEVEHDAQDDSGESVPGGGDGTSIDSIDIDFPSLPPSTLLNSGIVKMYNPDATQMNNFVNFIYSAPDNVIANFKKLWVNPMDSIISLALSPVAVHTTTAEEIKFCGVGSSVYASVIPDQYMEIDCGSLYIPEEYKTLLDYSNYTKIQCFLPFFGFVSLDADEVVGSTVYIKYMVDLLTGEALAIIKAAKTKIINSDVKIEYNSCLYQFKGNILTQAPLTGNNYQQLYSGVLNLVTAVALPNPASVAGVANDLLGQKVTTQHGGSITGNGGALGHYTPYIVITKPIRHKPVGFEQGFGYPSDLGGYKLSAYSGYVEIDSTALRLESVPFTDFEKNELKNILESGIII